MSHLSLDEGEQIVSADRTPVIDEVVRRLNAGEIRLPKNHPELETILKHFSTMKRVTRQSETTGENITHWTSTSKENHYFFALVYLAIAESMVHDEGAVMPVPVAGLIRKVKVGENLKEDESKWNRLGRVAMP